MIPRRPSDSSSRKSGKPGKSKATRSRSAANGDPGAKTYTHPEASSPLRPDIGVLLVALDAGSGATLWEFNAGGRVIAAPITYAVGGRQQLTIAAGGSILTFGLPAPRLR